MRILWKKLVIVKKFVIDEEKKTFVIDEEKKHLFEVYLVEKVITRKDLIL